MKQVRGNCSCECVDGLQGRDCSKLDTSSGKISKLLVLQFTGVKHFLNINFNVTIKKCRTLTQIKDYQLSSKTKLKLCKKGLGPFASDVTQSIVGTSKSWNQ